MRWVKLTHLMIANGAEISGSSTPRIQMSVLLKVCGDNSCCLERRQVRAATPDGVCSQVSTEHTVPDSMWKNAKVFGKGCV